MSLLSRFKKPISKKWLIIFTFILVVIQFAVILAGPMFLTLASTMQNETLWMWFVFGIAIFEMLTVPLTTLIICVLLLERFFKIGSSKKKAFIWGFFMVLLISWIYTVFTFLTAGSVHYSAFFTFIASSPILMAIYEIKTILLSIPAYIPALIYVIFLKILNVQGIGKAGVVIIDACVVFVSWPIWGGILGMTGDWLFRKKVK